MAQIGPSFRAPIIDETPFTDKSLELLRFSSAGHCRMPEIFYQWVIRGEGRRLEIHGIDEPLLLTDEEIYPNKVTTV